MWLIGLPSITEWNTSEHRLIFVAIVNHVKVTGMIERYSQRERRRKKEKRLYIFLFILFLYWTVKSQFVWFLHFLTLVFFGVFTLDIIYILLFIKLIFIGYQNRKGVKNSIEYDLLLDRSVIRRYQRIMFFGPMVKLLDEYENILHEATYVTSEYKKSKSIRIWSEFKGDQD